MSNVHNHFMVSHSLSGCRIFCGSYLQIVGTELMIWPYVEIDGCSYFVKDSVLWAWVVETLENNLRGKEERNMKLSDFVLYLHERRELEPGDLVPVEKG